MLRDGIPIYPLHSLQDQALHGLILKEQYIESVRFEAESYVSMMSQFLTTSKTPQELFNKLMDRVDDVKLMLSYDEKSVVAKRLGKQAHVSNMVNLVNTLSKQK